MTRRRLLTDDQCKELARWCDELDQLGTRQKKCRELGVDIQTLRDAIKRGRGQYTKNTRRKLQQHEIEQLAQQICDSSRETTNDCEISEATTA
jgi:hypothetical protein